MAKLSGPLTKLTKLFSPYALKPGGEVYNLSQDLLFQQDSEIGDGVSFGPAFSGVPVGSIIGGDIINRNPSLAIKGAVFNSSPNTRVDLDDSLADYLSLTTKELTVSLWVSGSTFATTAGGLQTSYKLQASGSNGIQFVVGALDSASAGVRADYAIATVSNPGGIASNVVASTRKTAGLDANQLRTLGVASFRGRYVEVPSPSGLLNPINVKTRDWHHIVYVQKAAEDPVVPELNSYLGIPVSPLEGSSQNGKEGISQLWLDGELVYESPAFGQFPQGYSYYFYEQGLESLANKTNPAFPGQLTQLRTLRQSGAKAFLSGSSANGDAIAQLAIWKRCLTYDEIHSIYDGVQDGVHTTRVTSVSSAPRRLLGRNESSESGVFLNQGFQDAAAPPKSSPFFESNSEEKKVKGRVYQQFHNLDWPDDAYAGTIIGDGTSQRPESKVSAFRDSEDVTARVFDEEFLIPSGAAVIKIPIPNNDGFTVAGRYFTGDPSLTDKFVDYVGLSGGSSAIGTGFLYYSPKLKTWVEKRADASSSETRNIPLLTSPGIQASASNYALQVDPSGFNQLAPTIPLGEISSPVDANRVMSQFCWSPQFGYYVAHVEHLKQTGYGRVGWPTSFFGAPNAPKYHAYDHETIKLSDYINRPFILKRIEMKVPVKSVRRFGVNPGEPSPYAVSGNEYENQISNKKDIDNYVFFVYRQRRVSRNRDSSEDRNTSKRYLIASASVCYVNSASFGGAWKDKFYEPRASGGWSSVKTLSESLARPSDTEDYRGSPLTLIAGDNCVLHNPQHTFEWGMDRFLGLPGDTGFVNQEVTSILNLKMLPMVVPPAAGAPSLMPMSIYQQPPSFTKLNAEAFKFREGGNVGGDNLDYCNAYVTSGTRTNVDAPVGAPSLTLVSNMWPGGRRPGLIGTNGQLDPYDTTPDAGPAGFKLGMLDAIVQFFPTFTKTITIESKAFASVIDSFAIWRPTRGPIQGHGLSNFPFTLDGFVLPEKYPFQLPVDPQSVNVQTSIGGTPKMSFYGRQTRSTGNPDEWSIINDSGSYMGDLGWRFISSFALSDLTESQIYSPEILEPEDELIIGLDAGTFGPPDLDVDDLLLEGDTGLSESGTKRLFKNTYLKEDYRRTLADSRLRILSGEAEITLIGDFLEDQSPVFLSRSTPESDSVSISIGNDLITDRSYLFNTDLMSGSLFTRVFTGSEGPNGLIAGNFNAGLARRFSLDLGARRSF